MNPFCSSSGGRIVVALMFLLVTVHPLQADDNVEPVLHLRDAEHLALAADQRLVAAQLRTLALQETVQASGELDDPQGRLVLQSLPVDSFDFGQEPMTQLLVGIKQPFPAGSTRQLRRARSAAQVSEASAELAERRAMVLKSVRLAWLVVYGAVAEQRLLAQEQGLLRQTQPLLEGAYRAGKNRQLDLARLRLRIAQTEASLVASGSQERAQRAVLAQWVEDVDARTWPKQLPDTLERAPAVSPDANLQLVQLAAREAVIEQDIALAKEQFKSAWAAELNYGVRESRSNLLSLGVSLSLPVAKASRQTPELEGKRKILASVKAERHYRHDEVSAVLQRLQQEVDALSQQIAIYRQQIIPERQTIMQLVDSDYSAGKASATDVIEADTQLVNSQRQLLQLEIGRARKIIEIRYLSGEQEPLDASSQEKNP